MGYVTLQFKSHFNHILRNNDFNILFAIENLDFCVMQASYYKDYH